MKIAIYFVNLAAILATLTIIICSLKPTEIVFSDLQLVPLLLWNISPFFGIAVITRWLARSRFQLGLVLGVSLVTAALETWILIDALILNLHVLNFFLLVSLPGIAWMIVLILLVIILGVRFVEKKYDPMKV